MRVIQTRVLRALADAGKHPKLAMTGDSMRPLLHQPMVLALRANGAPRIGDVVTYEQDGRIVAHRVVSIGRRDVLVSGDAEPWRTDIIAREAIIGVVSEVYAHAGPAAARLDGKLFRARGWLTARSRRLRAAVITSWLRVASSLPWRRQRAFAALFEAMSAVVQADRGRLALALAWADPVTLAAAARRHRCEGVLLEGLRHLDLIETAGIRLGALLASDGRRTALRALAMRQQVVDVCATLRRRGVHFALLKGAARIYQGNTDAHLHSSVDIDVFVRKRDLDAAVDALQCAGYVEHATKQQSRAYRRLHHHAAPLHPRNGGLPIELHSSLARRTFSSLVLDWRSLEPQMSFVSGPAGEVRCLNAAASALHLAVHAIGLQRLRDCVLLAMQLLELDDQGRERLFATAAYERLDPIRLQASLACAVRLAGLQYESSDHVARYLSWVFRREELPAALRMRSQLVEAWYATGGRARKVNRSVPLLTAGLSRPAPAARVRTATGRIAGALGAVVYGTFLPASRIERLPR